MSAPQLITIAGREGTVVYLNDDWVPVPPERATLAKVVFVDGGSAFYRVTSEIVRQFADKKETLP
jgi:hypothetical protein